MPCCQPPLRIGSDGAPEQGVIVDVEVVSGNWRNRKGRHPAIHDCFSNIIRAAQLIGAAASRGHSRKQIRRNGDVAGFGQLIGYSADPIAQTENFMAGFDPKDSTSLDLAVPQWEANLSSDLRGKRVGIPKEYRIDGVPADINALWDKGIEWLKDAGATPVEISLPHTKYALPTYYIIAPAEASSNLARYDGVRYGLRDTPEGGNLDAMYSATRADGFGAEVKRRIMIGTYVLSAGFYDAYFTKAQRVRALIKQDFAKAFEQCDVILTPTAPSAAFSSRVRSDARRRWSIYMASRFPPSGVSRSP